MACAAERAWRRRGAVRRANVDEDTHFSVYGTFATSEADEPPQTWEHLVAVVGKLPLPDAYELADRCIGEWQVFLHERGLTTPPP